MSDGSEPSFAIYLRILMILHRLNMVSTDSMSADKVFDYADRWSPNG